MTQDSGFQYGVKNNVELDMKCAPTSIQDDGLGEECEAGEVKLAQLFALLKWPADCPHSVSNLRLRSDLYSSSACKQSPTAS